MYFYSANLLFIILVDDKKPRKRNDYDESVIVFRSRNYRQALKKAIKIGRSMEAEYENKFSQKVRWALVEIQKITSIGATVNGQEVSWRLHSRISQAPIKYRKRFKPEDSSPQEL